MKITPGKRAMSVRIDDVAGLNGLIQPDSRVDVLVTLRDEQKAGQQVSKLFMSNMRVLAVGTVDRSGPDNRPIAANTATLEVFPVEAERLLIAMREGSIQLVLRGYGDPDSIKTNGARSADVLAQLQSAPTVSLPARTGNAVRDRANRVARAFESISRPAAPAPVLPAAPTPTVAAAPPKPDSLSVQVIRGDKITQQKFEKSDSTKKKPGQP